MSTVIKAGARNAAPGAPAPGAASPRAVIRGEFGSPLAISIDYLNFTVPDGNVAAIVREVCALVGVSGGEDRHRGLHGYERSVDVGGFGIVAHGGVTQRGSVLVSLNGSGCQRVARFGALREWAQSLNARIARLDIAADDVHGEVLSVAGALVGYREGAFDRRGTKCKAHIVDDLGSGAGSTLYVGARLSGKLCRVYEKGRQMGDPSSPWVRAEVELHAKDRVIPWDAVTDPRPYFAGSYPFFSGFSLEEMRIRTFKHGASVTLDQLQVWARGAVGKTVNVMLREFEGDYGAVVTALRRDGVPRRLVSYEAAPLMAQAA